jgi:hypothetical protein
MNEAANLRSLARELRAAALLTEALLYEYRAELMEMEAAR